VQASKNAIVLAVTSGYNLHGELYKSPSDAENMVKRIRRPQSMHTSAQHKAERDIRDLADLVDEALTPVTGRQAVSSLPP